MIDWIYSTPILVWGALLVVLVVALSALGLAIMHRLVHAELRRKHNDATAATTAIVGVAYAVLLAFVAVATWENFASAEKVVDTEASCIGDLYRDTIGLPDDKAAPIRAGIKTYIDKVTAEEWPAQRRGEVSHAARPTLVHLHALIAGINPTTAGETVIVAELLRTMNTLYDARRSRFLATRAAIPAVIWWILGSGTAFTIASTFLFGTADFRMHLALTGVVAASMSLVIVLIVALDRPFRGELSVTVDAYQNARGSIAGVDSR